MFNEEVFLVGQDPKTAPEIMPGQKIYSLSKIDNCVNKNFKLIGRFRRGPIIGVGGKNSKRKDNFRRPRMAGEKRKSLGNKDFFRAKRESIFSRSKEKFRRSDQNTGNISWKRFKKRYQCKNRDDSFIRLSEIE